MWKKRGKKCEKAVYYLQRCSCRGWGWWGGGGCLRFRLHGINRESHFPQGQGAKCEGEKSGYYFLLYSPSKASPSSKKVQRSTFSRPSARKVPQNLLFGGNHKLNYGSLLDRKGGNLMGNLSSVLKQTRSPEVSRHRRKIRLGAGFQAGDEPIWEEMQKPITCLPYSFPAGITEWGEAFDHSLAGPPL